MEKQLQVINKSLEQLSTCHTEIFDQEGTIEADISSKIKLLHEALDNRKTKLVSDLHQITQAKLKELAVQKDKLETIQAQLSSCLEIMRESLKTSSHKQVLVMKTDISKRVNELTVPFEPALLSPSTEADIILSNAEGTAKMCDYGQISTLDCPDPSKSYLVHDKSTEMATLGEKSTVCIQLIDFRGNGCEKLIQTLDCELISLVTGIKAKETTVDCRGKGQYEISYLPVIAGRHQLHIKISNQHIRGSPFEVRARTSVDKVTTPSLIIGQLKNPCAVIVNHKQQIVVAEVNKHCISLLNAKGEKLRSFGSFGQSPGQLEYPLGVTIDGSGNFLVADTHNHRIQKFSREGEFIVARGKQGSGPLHFFLPLCILFNPINNKIYVTDKSIFHHIQILNSDLTFYNYLGKEGSNPGQFLDPRGLAADSKRQVYVADNGNHRIQVFTAKGKFLRTFGRFGEGRGALMYPYYVAVDSNSDTVYVSNRKIHLISVFTAAGQYVTSFGQHGNRPGEFHDPCGLAVDNSGKLYVCDGGNNRIQMFK